jgi:hypothetical protein
LIKKFPDKKFQCLGGWTFSGGQADKSENLRIMMGPYGFGVVFILKRSKPHKSVGYLALNFTPKTEIIIYFTAV